MIRPPLRRVASIALAVDVGISYGSSEQEHRIETESPVEESRPRE